MNHPPLQLPPLRPHELIALFPDVAPHFGAVSPIAPDAMPPDAVTLLVHSDHMTDALERFHGTSVRVSVVTIATQPDFYARMSLLTRSSDAQIVQIGIVRLFWEFIPAPVREAMEQATSPLGRILAELNVLRTVQFERLWEVRPGPFVRELVRVPTATNLYGRTARIRVHDSPAIDLLEIVILPQNSQ